MDVNIAEAKNNLPSLIRAFESGEQIVITRNGKPVAQLTAPPPGRAVVRLGTMRGRVKLTPGWDDPIELEQFLTGRL